MQVRSVTLYTFLESEALLCQSLLKHLQAMLNLISLDLVIDLGVDESSDLGDLHALLSHFLVLI